MESVPDLIKCKECIVSRCVINQHNNPALAFNWAELNRMYGLPSHLKGYLAGTFALPNHYSPGLLILKAYPCPCCNIVHGYQNPSGLFTSLCCYCDVIHEPPKSGRWCCQLEFYFEDLANAWLTVKLESVAWDLLDDCKPYLEWAPLMMVILNYLMRSCGIGHIFFFSSLTRRVRSRFTVPGGALDTTCLLYKAPGPADDLACPILSFISCHVGSVAVSLQDFFLCKLLNLEMEMKMDCIWTHYVQTSIFCKCALLATQHGCGQLCVFMYLLPNPTVKSQGPGAHFYITAAVKR